MKQHQHSMLPGHKTTSADVVRWAQELFRLHARLAPALRARNRTSAS